MWRVTTNAIGWEKFPGEVLALIRAKVDELASGGFTTIQDAAIISIIDGQERRQRDFTTLESAQDYADFITGLPGDSTSVISTVEIV